MVQRRACVGELEKIFAELASSAALLGGDKPNQADVYALTMILFGHNIYLGGLPADPAAVPTGGRRGPSLMPSSAVDGAPSCKCYRTKSTVRPAMAFQHVDDGARRDGR